MALELDPAELSFRRPFTQEVSQVLRLKNTNDKAVAFKVKTTAPKQYCVRPNSGKIEPGESVDVSVVLQPMKQDPGPEVRCKDKFLVQSIGVPPGHESLGWPELERTSGSSIQDRKIRVQYLPADRNQEPQNFEDTSVISSPPPVYTPHTQSNGFSERQPDQSSSPIVKNEPDEPTAKAENFENANSGSLQAQLAEAQTTISKLRRQLDEQASGLRQRKPEAKELRGSASDLGVPVLQQQARGVPVKWVAILCLIAFLLGYFIF